MNKLYIKKPVVIEAIQFTRNNIDEIKEFTNNAAYDFRTERRPEGKMYCTIKTLEGYITATEGDYIIKGIAGEIYPCKPDIFKRTYEEAYCDFE